MNSPGTGAAGENKNPEAPESKLDAAPVAWSKASSQTLVCEWCRKPSARLFVLNIIEQGAGRSAANVCPACFRK